MGGNTPLFGPKEGFEDFIMGLVLTMGKCCYLRGMMGFLLRYVSNVQVTEKWMLQVFVRKLLSEHSICQWTQCYDWLVYWAVCCFQRAKRRVEEKKLKTVAFMHRLLLIPIITRFLPRKVTWQITASMKFPPRTQKMDLLTATSLHVKCIFSYVF